MKQTSSLTLVPEGITVKVKALRVTGSIRRRLLDLGFTVGNIVTPLYSDRTKSITAYGINGAIIALRREDAINISIEYIEEAQNEQTNL